MPVFGSNLLTSTSNTNLKKNGSLSDSSMCELPSLTEAAVSRHQQMSNPRQGYMLPTYKKNGTQSRKRFLSASDRDQSATSGYECITKKSCYEGNTKKCKRESKDSSITKMCNPVMENSVSSTKTEMIVKLNKLNSAEDIQVTYTLEERIRCAAFAVTYNNCKIATDKFESLFSKPAPDFNTIFEWRHRLISTGCLIDSHIEKEKSFQTKSVTNTDNTNTKVVCKLPNPEEIIIPSESEEEDEEAEASNKTLEKSVRCMSSETLFIGGNTELQAAGSLASTVDGRGSRARSCSQSTHLPSRSNSRDSQDSHYPDTESEKASGRNSKEVLKSTNVSARQSVHGSDSESVSYNSGEDNFLSRVFGEGRKRRKVKKHIIPAAVPQMSDYATNDVNTFGYNTFKKSEQSPLVTGNIYTNNLRNMNTRTRQNVDIDGCSSEYVPTKMGSTAKKNYQEFKDNVRKKGYWAKGNGSSLTINRHNMSMDVIHKTKGIPNQTVEETVKPVSSHQYDTIQTESTKSQANDFTRVNIKNITSTNSYLPFDKPIQTVNNIILKDKSSENTDRIFAQVQSNNVSRNKSILDIFDISDPAQRSPPSNNDLDKYDNIRRMYENEWDEDDDALYKNTDCEGEQIESHRVHSPTVSNRTQSPTSDMLYTTEKATQLQDTCENKLLPDFIKEKHDLLLDMLKDFQNKEISQMVSPLKHIPQLPSVEDNNVYQKSVTDTMPNSLMTGFESISLPAPRPDPMSNLLMTRPDPIPNTSMVRSDRISNPALDRFDPGPNHIIDRNDAIPRYPVGKHDRANRSETMSNHNTNRPDTSPNYFMSGISPIPKQSITSPDRISNLRLKRSDLSTSPMTRPDPNSNLCQHNEGLNHMISQSDFTQNLNSNTIDPISNLPMIGADQVPNHTMTRSELNSNFTMKIPDPIPVELSNEVLRLSEGNVESTQHASNVISPSKRVHILENITIQPGSPHQNITPSYQQNTSQHSSPEAAQRNDTKFISSSPKLDEKQDTIEKPPEKEQPLAQLDFSNLLTGINTSNLLLALQNLQQIAQSSSPKLNEEINTDQPSGEEQSTEEQAVVAETINLTNDEEWEKESNRDGSIERQLEQMDGTGDTPFLSDIFDPGPVLIPANVMRKLNLESSNLEGAGTDTNSNENAPVIGNFKSFALPKPILLNRLKLTVKTAEKPMKKSSKMVKQKNKVCINDL